LNGAVCRCPRWSTAGCCLNTHTLPSTMLPSSVSSPHTTPQQAREVELGGLAIAVANQSNRIGHLERQVEFLLELAKAHAGIAPSRNASWTSLANRFKELERDR
jgi:hypothetical protein